MVFYRTEGYTPYFTAAESVSEDEAQTHTKQEIRVAAAKACQSFSRKETASSDVHGRYSFQRLHAKQNHQAGVLWICFTVFLLILVSVWF